MERLLLLFACLLVIHSAATNPVPFIKKCKDNDNKCLKESAQAAIPIYALGLSNIGVDSIDPLHISMLDASTSGLKLIITNAVITGLKDCRVKKISRDLEKSKLLAKLECNINLEGQYEMDGQLLILPMKGNGPIHVKLRKLEISAELDLDEKMGKDNKPHWAVKAWKHSYKLNDKADVDFENLFKDNEVLGRVARDLVANSGNEIIDEVGPPVLKTVIEHLVRSINKFFNKVPLEHLVEN